MNNEKNKIINDMKFLIEELHKEWDRTGAKKASVIIFLEEVENINQIIVMRITKTQELAESDTMTFKESIQLSKECFILLRLARKIKDMQEKTNKKRMDNKFSVAFDEEELQLFNEMFNGKSE